MLGGREEMISRLVARGAAEPPVVQRAETRLLVDLGDASRATAERVGRKAANLAQAMAIGLPVLPGFVLLPEDGRGFPEAPLRVAWRHLSQDGSVALVVRSSSSAEDDEISSMAGRFTSVVDVRGWPAFLAAIERVRDSAKGVGGVVSMAVLVQPLLECAWGGVLFGVDPVSGRRDRIVVAAVRGGPAELVSGAVSGARYTLTRRGRVVQSDGDRLPAFPKLRRRLALLRLARKTAAVFGGPQDIEWAIDPNGQLWLLQSRPITALADGVVSGPVFGPGPVAETFPEPLLPLEEDLWVAPLRRAVSLTLRLTAAAGGRRIASSPVVTTVEGRVAVDLDLVGDSRPTGWRRLDPRPSLRRLGAAWRVGRLRAALPGLTHDLIRRVDAELAEVPSLESLPDELLLRLLERSREGLVSLHGLEMLAGSLDPSSGPSSTAAARALRKLVAGRVEGRDDDEIIASSPEVLALTAPGIRRRTSLPALAPATVEGAEMGPLPPREALRLRCRWLHEMMALSAWELGCRLVRRSALAKPGDVALLRWEELEPAVGDGRVPEALEERRLPPGAPLPAAFRLSDTRAIVPVRVTRSGQGQGAGGGRGMGVVHGGVEPPVPGKILVVRTLDPDLAVHLPGLAGLVAETGSVLSHLAILAREFGVPTVVGVDGAVDRYPPGTVLVVDGATGEVTIGGETG